MPQVNLLTDYPLGGQRQRTVTPEDRTIAKLFGEAYFDGDRRYGYGGYRDDGRWAAVAKRIVDYYNLPRESRILDVGCAKGFLVWELNNLGMRAYGLDISQYAIDHGKAPWNLSVGTATKLPQPGVWKAFDLAISINTLHNLVEGDVRVALHELMRVAKRQYVQVDSWFTESQHKAFEAWQLTAQTAFDPAGWQNLFEEVGYTGEYWWTIT